MELWKDIDEYIGLYQVSNYGNVRSINRTTTRGITLKPIPDKDGYLRVCLCKNNNKKNFSVHRLVANAFVSGKTKTDCIVNHKDENKGNNIFSNLEWCSIGYNTCYKNSNYRRMELRKKPVICLETGKTYSSSQEAALTTHTARGNIVSCLTGRRKSAGGYTWSYA